LRFDRHGAVGAVLEPKLDVEQAQEVLDLGQRADGALAPAAAGALLDGHRRRDAEDGVDVGPRRGLHELAGVGVERLEVAPLPLGEEDVEGQRGLARARDAGDDGEAVARDVDVDALQVVLAGVVDADHPLTPALSPVPGERGHRLPLPASGERAGVRGKRPLILP
jgi:hypothetical protein